MMESSFELVPFPGPEIPKIQITGNVVREGCVLSIQYSLFGMMGEILLPPLNPGPGRKNDLWLTTCFEFFLAFPDRPQYWECNLSPSGDWNIYRMDAYRQISFQEEGLIHDIQLTIQRKTDRFGLKTVVDLSPLLVAEDQLQMGISCVIQSVDGHESYWALLHPGSQADFHQRESFILTLEG